MSEAMTGPRRCLGWTGHRVVENERAVTDAIREVISELTSRAPDGTTRSASGWFGFGSAAIGADLMVAQACLQSGIPVRIVLPCSLDEMLALTPNEHKCDFTRICVASEVAPTVLSRNNNYVDHAAVAREIASMADVLIAVWDGSPARGPGGTANVVELSRERGTRIIRIDPTTGDWD
ncbi:MAG: hypothetical protein KF902_04810 [Phycisphaeraceae bacterium]|nr:hypothetical protein [Phycisphaeraceae bacterium]